MVKGKKASKDKCNKCETFKTITNSVGERVRVCAECNRTWQNRDHPVFTVPNCEAVGEAHSFVDDVCTKCKRKKR